MYKIRHFLIISCLITILLSTAKSEDEEIEFYLQGPWALASNCDFMGMDLDAHEPVKDEEICRFLCDTYTFCTHYTYDAREKICYIKSGRVTFQDACPRHPEDGLNCGIRCLKVLNRDCREILRPSAHSSLIFYDGEPAGFFRARNCFFDQNPYMRLYQLSIEECANECRNKGTCTHFNYLTGYCDLFNERFERSLLKEIHNGFSYCGFDCDNADNYDICVNKVKKGVNITFAKDPSPQPILFSPITNIEKSNYFRIDKKSKSKRKNESQNLNAYKSHYLPPLD